MIFVLFQIFLGASRLNLRIGNGVNLRLSPPPALLGARTLGKIRNVVTMHSSRSMGSPQALDGSCASQSSHVMPWRQQFLYHGYCEAKDLNPIISVDGQCWILASTCCISFPRRTIIATSPPRSHICFTFTKRTLICQRSNRC